MTTLDLAQQGMRFEGDNSILAQIGWVGHRAGDTYPILPGPTVHQEPGGFTPLYIIVGRYVRDKEGNKLWED